MKKVLAFILSGMILFATLGTAFAEEFIEVDYQTQDVYKRQEQQYNFVGPPCDHSTIIEKELLWKME